MLETMRRHGITLAIFAACTTGLTAIVYSLTKDRIAEQAVIQHKTLLDQVVPPALYDNQMQDECYLVTDKALGNKQTHRLYLARKNGIPAAAALESTAPDGYSGAIQLLVGANFSGKVLGVRVTEHHETPGLGDKIDTRISDWIYAFSGKKVMSKNDPKLGSQKRWR